MSISKKRRNQILSFLSRVPIGSTDQFAHFFKDCSQPLKRVSQCLVELEKEKLIEGRRRREKTKVWRLTSQYKKQIGLKKRGRPLTLKDLDHTLAIGDMYIQLFLNGRLDYFIAEPREDVFLRGTDAKFMPDAFFVYDKKPYLLEIQRSPLSKIKWSIKWEYVQAFLQNGMEGSSFAKHLTREPEIVVLSNQKFEDVMFGKNELNVQLHDDVFSFLRFNQPFFESIR